jgi:hypothetical protein
MARGLLGLVDPGTWGDVIRTVSATLSDKYEEGIGMRLGAAAWIAEARVNRRP